MPGDPNNLLDAYHDGALGASERAAYEAHLAECGECRRALDDLERISRMLSGAALPEMPAELAGRLVASFAGAERKQEQGVRRLAGWLTVAAAAALVLATFRFTGETNSPNDSTIAETTAAAREWEFAAVMPPPDRADDAGSADIVQLAQWMARDL